MRPTIGRWHTRYRVAGAGGNGAARLESGVRERVAESYAAAVEQVFGEDPAVYVLRSVRTELTVVNPSASDERAIAQAWGERTCAAVVRTVLRHGDDASQVMRFDNTAAFIAQWIADLLDGVAWERWYYGAFRPYRGMRVEDAIRAVLLEHREHLAAILRRLAKTKRLPMLLPVLSPDSVRELWQVAVRGEARDEATSEQFRLFVRAAIEVVSALEIWSGEPRAVAEIFAAYEATAPHAPDWKQPRALAEAVFAVVAFLERRGFVRIERTALTAPRWREVVEALEWLDREWLASAIEAWLREEPAPVPAAARPATPTALQQRIVSVLRRLVENGTATLPDRGKYATPRNAFALFAALASEEPLLAEHPAAPAAIESFLKTLEFAQVTATVAPRSTERTLIESAFAGVFVLSRALLETRLTQLANVFGLPVPSLLLALAAEWGADARDAGIVHWSGSDGEVEPLDPALCERLREEVVQLMHDRAAFAPSLAPDENDTEPPLAAIARHLVRLWAHWLPGLGQSSVPWLLQQFILRRGVLRVNGGELAISLAPAPLDVVLEMAGYLAPIASVPWLGDRRVTFAIDRSLA